MKERKYLLAKEKSNTKMYVIGFIIIVVFVALFSLSGSRTEQNTNNINNINTNNVNDITNTEEFIIKSVEYTPENPKTADIVNITVILENNNPRNIDYTLIMKYGDSGATGVSGAANEPKTHIFNHVYTNEGTYTIKASLKINDEIRSELTKDIVIS
jgi:hypothetical protein